MVARNIAHFPASPQDVVEALSEVDFEDLSLFILASQRTPSPPDPTDIQVVISSCECLEYTAVDLMI